MCVNASLARRLSVPRPLAADEHKPQLGAATVTCPVGTTVAIRAINGHHRAGLAEIGSVCATCPQPANAPPPAAAAPAAPSPPVRPASATRADARAGSPPRAAPGRRAPRPARALVLGTAREHCLNRAGSSAASGTWYGMRASLILRLARTDRCAIVGSATRKARATSSVRNEPPPAPQSDGPGGAPGATTTLPPLLHPDNHDTLGNRMWCPPGTVPVVRHTLAELAAAMKRWTSSYAGPPPVAPGAGRRPSRWARTSAERAPSTSGRRC